MVTRAQLAIDNLNNRNNDHTGLALVQTRGEGAIVNTRVDVSGQVVEDLEGQMTQRLLGPFDQFARVGLGKRDTKVLSSRFPDALRARVDDIMVMGLAGECVHVANEAGQIFVGDVRFKAELVLQSNGERQDEVHGSTVGLRSVNRQIIRARVHIQLPQQIDLALLSVTFTGVDPDGAGQVAGRLDQLRPILPSICPSDCIGMSVSIEIESVAGKAYLS